MVNNFNDQELLDIMKEIKNWELIQSTPQNFFEWSVGISRIHAAFAHVPSKQKLFGAKQFISTFHTDDPIEKLNSKPEFSGAADELINNLRKIFSGKFDQTTDMNQFKEQDNIPDSCIESAVRAINIQIEMVQLAEELLKPKVCELFRVACHGYLDGVLAERVLFHKHFSIRTSICELEGKAARLNSIGFNWVLPTMMTDENTAENLNFKNPLVTLAAWISVLENDLIGSCKDKTIDYSPMSFYQLGNLGKTEVEAAKISAIRANEAKKAFEYVCGIVPVENLKHYEYLAIYVGVLLDYSFVSGRYNKNTSY